MAYRFRRRMRQIGIGYRVRTVITLLSRMGSSVILKKKKKRGGGECNNYETIMTGKKKVFQRKRNILKGDVRGIEKNTIFFSFQKMKKYM